MDEHYKHQVKFDTHLTHTATWARIDKNDRLVVEFYDFSDQADSAFGNDVAYLLIVAPEHKSLILSKLDAEEPIVRTEPIPDIELLNLLKQRFDGYFSIQKWFDANEIPFEKVFDGWA